jgi:hypothetical protein
MTPMKRDGLSLTPAEYCVLIAAVVVSCRLCVVGYGIVEDMARMSGCEMLGREAGEFCAVIGREGSGMIGLMEVAAGRTSPS